MVALTLCLPSSSGAGAGVTPKFVGREMPDTSPGIFGISASAFSIASLVLFSTLVVALASLIENRHCMFTGQRLEKVGVILNKIKWMLEKTRQSMYSYL